MPWAVDGSNLGGLLAGGRGARDRELVIRRLLPWARHRKVVVVFDGPDDDALARSYGGLDVRYGGARSADAAILRLVAARPRDWRVVTDDRALGRAAQDAGCTWMRAADWIARHERRGEEPPAEEPRVDVDDWEAWFRRGGS